jgi:cytochrome oxidase Cu insertion factor (SCO1/SenC/PrrC family)
MTRTRILARLFLISCLALAVNRSLDAAKPAPEEQTGIKVGEKAPEFSLKDQQGVERSLKDLLKQDKVALVFYRSAEW